MLIAIVTVSNTVKHALPCDSSTQGDCSGYGGYDMGGGIIIGAEIFFCGLCIAIVAGGLVGGLALMGGIAGLATSVIAAGMGAHAPVSRGRDW